MPSKDLPHHITPLVGKKSDLEAISAHLQNPYCRLLTLVGTGGIGKTRLAVEVISQPGLNLPDGIYFVDLQSLSSIDNIPQSIAFALGYNFQGGKDPEEELLAFIREKRLLIILDNFEHLLPAHEFVTAMLDQALDIKLLITSRERLKLREEWIYEIHSLSIPPEANAESLETYEAVQLFVEHAQRVRHDFSLNAETASVERICRLTEGIPLAIELATAWVRTLPCSEIANQLQDKFDILQSDLHDVPDRHRSMRTVFDYSWNLLTKDERHVMMGASVFRGGFRREAAETVLGASLKTLSLLVDKSLLRVADNGRYTIHELQRQYAEERLNEFPDQQRTFRDQHCVYYANFMDRPISDFVGGSNNDVLLAIDADIDNVRLAWATAVENLRIAELKQMAEGIYWYTWLRVGYQEGRKAFTMAVDALRSADPTPENQIVLGIVLADLGALYIWIGQAGKAQEYAEESVAILRRQNATPDLGSAVGALGWAHCIQHNWEVAVPLLEEAVKLDEVTGQYELQAFILGLLGNVNVQIGHLDIAEQWHQQSLLIGKRIDDKRTISNQLLALGNIAFFKGVYYRARAFYQQGLAIAMAHQLPSFIVGGLRQLSMVAEAIGEMEEARSYLETSLSTAKEHGKLPPIANVLNDLAHIMLVCGDVDSAQEYWREAYAISLQLDDRRMNIILQTSLADLSYASGDYAQATHLYLESLSHYRQTSHQISIGRILVALGNLALSQWDIVQSRKYLYEALETAHAIGSSPSMLRAIASLADLFMQQGQLSHAVELAALVFRHPASHADAKAVARRVLSNSEVELFAADLEPVVQHRTQDDLVTVAANLIQQLEAQTDQPLIEPLSDRELEVLQLVANGRSNRQIAQDLILAVGTVKTHLHNILQKLDADNRTEAVTRARDLNLLK